MWNDQNQSETTRNQSESTKIAPGTYQELTRIGWFWLIPSDFLVGSDRFPVGSVSFGHFMFYLLRIENTYWMMGQVHQTAFVLGETS